MLLKHKQSRFIFLSLILVFSNLINGCINSRQLEESIKPDPSLETSTNQAQAEQSSSNLNQKSEANRQKQNSNQQQAAQDKQKNNSSSTRQNLQASSQKAFADLPENLPFYPQASLKVIVPQSSSEFGASEWRSSDDPNTIVNYYQEKWESSPWEIVQPFRANENKSGLDAIVRRDGLDFKIDLAIAEPTTEDSQLETRLKISYQAAGETKIQASDILQPKNPQVSDFQQPTAREKTKQETSNNQTAIPVKNDSNLPGDSSSLPKPQKVPEQLLSYVRDVRALGITDSPNFNNKENKAKFDPNEIITRREYARWLFIANNTYYADVPGNKIRLASSSNEPVFKDIRVQDSDFEEIQGLAEAGIIPSILTNDSSNILFDPDEPLTREDLITWKVPLDTRRGLPKADANAIQEAWGFQDTNQINILALRALFADYQNGEQSNLKRVFGYTTLFRPQQVVTKAEAAASLWYLGFQGDGITAQDKLKASKSAE